MTHPLRNQRVHLPPSNTTYTVRGPDAAGLLWLLAPGLPPISLPVAEATARLVMAHPTPSAPIPAPPTAPDLVAALTAHAGATIRARDLASTLLGRPATPVEVRQLIARVRALPNPLPIPGGTLSITIAREHNARTLTLKKFSPAPCAAPTTR